MKIYKSLVVSCFFVANALMIGCANEQIKPTIDETRVFSNASQMVGEKVTIRGYLRYEFENKNLFPVDNKKTGLVRGSCLPFLIKMQNNRLIEEAGKLNDSLVIVSGTIANAADPGMVSVTTCKQVGIDLDSIKSL